MAVKYLVRFAGEIGTKSKFTRKQFVKRLADNIRSAAFTYLRNHHPGEKAKPVVNISWNNIILESPVSLGELLSEIPGIQTYSRIHVYAFEGLEKALDTAGDFFKEELKGKSFAVRCKKQKGLSFKSMDVERELGARLLEYAEKVDLSNPEITCYLQFRHKDFFLYSAKKEGMKGMPAGSTGKVLTLMSGGFDSPVASWKGYKSGLEQDFIYFDLGGEDQKKCVIRSVEFIKDKWAHGTGARFFVVDFIPVIREIRKADPRYHNLLLKYCFYKAGEKLAGKIKTEALLTGEAVGQVSTQTLSNLQTLDKVTDLLIIRPLITMYKEEIIILAEQTGTAGYAYTGKEYCALSARNVATTSTIEELMKEVEKIDLTMLDKVLEEMREPLSGKNSEIKKSVIPGNAAVIDIRPSEDFSKNAFENAENIPFEQAWNEFSHWDRNKKYFLVCQEGSKSTVLAHYMKEEEFDVEHLEGGMKRLEDI